MNDAISIEIKEFIRLLEKAKKAATNNDDLEEYERAIRLSNELLKGKGFSGSEFSQLKRLVGDSLPWGGGILIPWNKIIKMVRQDCADSQADKTSNGGG